MTKQPLTPAAEALSPFDAAAHLAAWPYRFEGTLFLPVVVGGTPTDLKVAENWLRSKLADPGDIIREEVAKIMAERATRGEKVTVEEATAELDRNKHLNGFKRTDDVGLCLEGRHLKACVKEATMVAVAAEKIVATGWGKTNKNIKGFVAEHIVVVDDRLHLYRDDDVVNEPSGVMQRFVHTWRGNAIQYEEYVEDCYIDFTVMTDHKFDDRFWSMMWLTAEQQGLGASRSQGFGRFSLRRWEQVS